LLHNVRKALVDHPVPMLVVAGGVAANSELRTQVRELGEEHQVEVVLPPLYLCTDNGAMVAAAGYKLALKQETVGLDLNATASSLWSRRGELRKGQAR